MLSRATYVKLSMTRLWLCTRIFMFLMKDDPCLENKPPLNSYPWKLSKTVFKALQASCMWSKAFTSLTEKIRVLPSPLIKPWKILESSWRHQGSPPPPCSHHLNFFMPKLQAFVSQPSALGLKQNRSYVSIITKFQSYVNLFQDLNTSIDYSTELWTNIKCCLTCVSDSRLPLITACVNTFMLVFNHCYLFISLRYYFLTDNLVWLQADVTHCCFGEEIKFWCLQYSCGRNIYFFFPYLNKQFVSQRKIRTPEHCLKLERWQGPPNINKVKVVCLQPPVNTSCLSSSRGEPASSLGWEPCACYCIWLKP